MMPHADFWRGKRVLVTGHTGFKGGWLALWLKRLGAELAGLSLPPETTPNLYHLAHISEGLQDYLVDVRNPAELQSVFSAFQPEVVFHLAAQPLVRLSYREPVSTIATNVMGVANVLEAVRHQGSVRVIVMATTDKVYRNTGDGRAFHEDDPLGGHDPYSASKAASELIVDSYRDSFLRDLDVAVATARAGNVIGGGDWSEDRLIPDAIRAWQKGEVLDIRRPDAIRPWQHVLEPLNGYLILAQRLWEQPNLAGAYNLGPFPQESATVREVIEMARTIHDGRAGVRYAEVSDGPHEAHRLVLDIGKAQSELAVVPRWTLPEAMSRTIRWYTAQHAGMDARALCTADITAYES